MPQDDFKLPWIIEFSHAVQEFPALALDGRLADALAVRLASDDRWGAMGGRRAAIVWASENGGGKEARDEVHKRVGWILKFQQLFQNHSLFDERLSQEDIQTIACFASDDERLFAMEPEDAICVFISGPLLH